MSGGEKFQTQICFIPSNVSCQWYFCPITLSQIYDQKSESMITMCICENRWLHRANHCMQICIYKGCLQTDVLFQYWNASNMESIVQVSERQHYRVKKKRVNENGIDISSKSDLIELFRQIVSASPNLCTGIYMNVSLRNEASERASGQ